MKFGKTLIIGDSYSTFEGYIPKNYDTWYVSEKTEKPDVYKVEQTWWYQIFDGKDNKLMINDSYSGATVCNSVRPEHTVDVSFVSRFEKLVNDGFFDNNEIDSVIVFGYTNDSWTNVSFGNEKYSNFKKEDLLEFCPAVCYLAAKIKEVLPNANVLWLLNTDVDEKFPKAVKTIATHFEQKHLHFEDIDKLSGHPSIKGMKQIAEAIKNL